tara:strand:+ start:934 stop:1545 length:612 start_codon:yes stop_codon:yes gene_type:complete
MKNSIYKITNPEGKIYIGQAADTDKRFKHYKDLNCKTQATLYASLTQYSPSNHTFEVLESNIDKTLLNTRERYYQDKFNSMHEGLNGCLVNTPTKKKVMSKNARLKMKLNHMGTTGLQHSAETKAKLSQLNKGRKISAESKAKMSAARKGKKGNNSKMVMYNGVLYSTVKELAQILGYKSSTYVVSMLKGKSRNKFNLQYVTN